MTLDEFFAKLEQTPREWELETSECDPKRKWIALGPHCPLSFVAGTEPLRVNLAALALDLDLRDALAIADAADNVNVRQPGFGKMRRRLLKACGLV